MTDLAARTSRAPSTAVRVTVAEAGGGTIRRRDRVAGEEPLEIRAAGPGQEAVRVAVTMRTPGSDFELAAGFLFSEGLIANGREIAQIRYCGLADAEQEYNILTVHLHGAFDAGALQRNFYATSSCGICGKAAIDQIEVQCAPIADGPVVHRSIIAGLAPQLRERQRLFDETGGLHAAGLFDPDGALLGLREDVGRHNAMDKLLGAEALAGRTPLGDRIVLVSGRASFELVQKAAVAGVPILCAVSAPSSLAIETARRLGLTLVGFLRDDRFTIYCHPERIALGPA